MLPEVNRWINGVWDDPDEPVTYDVLYARQKYYTGRNKRSLARGMLIKRTRLSISREVDEDVFIGCCHEERLLYYDVCTPDGEWTRHAAAGISMLDVPLYSIDEEWIFTQGSAYNAGFAVYPEEPLMSSLGSVNTWTMLQPAAWREETLASLKRMRVGIEATGFTFKLCQQFPLEIPGFRYWRGSYELATMDAVRNAFTSYHKILFDLERLGFVVDQFKNRDIGNISECTTVAECIQYLIDKTGCTNEDNVHNIVYKIIEEFEKRYRVTMSINIAYGAESVTWMRNRKATLGNGTRAVGDLAVLPDDVLTHIFAETCLHLLLH